MRRWTQRTLRLAATVGTLTGFHWMSLHAQEVSLSSVPGASPSASAVEAVYLPYAQFHIPFDIDQAGAQPTSVQLYVSTDQGTTWQLHGKTMPNSRRFEFRAAAEGEYLFTVQTLDSAGISFPSPNPPLRVLIDTTKPQASIQADLDHNGSLIIDLRVFDRNLDLQSATLKVRTERDSRWREIDIENLSPVGDHFEGQIELILPPCREVLMVLSVQDLAKNNTEVSHRFVMPRTAVGQSDMQLASTRPGVNIPGAVSWDAETEEVLTSNSVRANKDTATNPTNQKAVKSDPGQLSWDSKSRQAGSFPTSVIQTTQPEGLTGPGRFASKEMDLELSPNRRALGAEEIPPPQPIEPNIREQQAKQAFEEPVSLGLESSNLASGSNQSNSQFSNQLSRQTDENRLTETQQVDSQNPYYCRSRTFSLDYSVQALGGNILSEVELWGTEDNGRTWQKWGTDPDRVSPFDVRVGNDGLFGFRMVIVGQSGQVMGQPKPGEPADVWIFVDTETPTAKITRAVYGDGSEAGMLVIDYSCSDAQLADYPISLSYSHSSDGPWNTFASGLTNTGLYLWKVEPNVPNQVFLKIDAVDKAGNIGSHRLDLPIDIKGLSPRGRIQGFRPIIDP